ncbi:MAG: rod shape-determining protein RodA [Ilumatobacter sp.]|jgi:rod shape determining protein RodA|uniref:FtsW/RodA/SpoVE family cell cycle protein n=1 Tax=Ilumatobacter sp. TaxID=1967498 RepID=UPI001DA89B54|nr:rod shape-determining protein RodA [Ilumatobacter sp.]MBT5275456.1 rod shape-determining protein RodA [Ilumatobacter sp.]MBT5554838.1 rod shape-determining protein RodA [Ilumatobacter sp.]MBT5864274.1 rod shape-determining protein RodA [Ilumatobacter sp.]MDG0978040.1 FtsW/RodA/SpoVE family cell cycle protein [Ilumatobacter sp.]
MATSFLTRKPDSGLGNIGASPADPSRNIDWVLMSVQMILTVAGCFVVFSASRTRVVDDPYAFATRQVIFAIVATAVMAVVMAFDYESWKERATFLYGLTLVVLVLLILLGVAGGQDRISFDLGPFNVQPAEMAKFTTLLMLAVYLAQERSDEVSYPRFLGGLMIVGVPAVLIVLQPDLGSASVIISMAMGVLLVAGAKVRYIALISVLSIATVAAAFFGRLVDRYQITRLEALINPDGIDSDFTYQAENAMRAIGTGGVWGKGWLQGPLTNGRDIPVMWADFPFAAVGEQFGLVGCAAMLALFGVALIRIWRIAHLSRDLLGTYICAGVFTMLLWQIFQNVGMTLQIMPVTGLPLPFISYGGSSLIVYFAMFGLVQSVHMRRMR